MAPHSTFAFSFMIAIWESRPALAGCKKGWATGQFPHLILGLPNMVTSSSWLKLLGGLLWPLQVMPTSDFVFLEKKTLTTA